MAKKHFQQLHKSTTLLLLLFRSTSLLGWNVCMAWRSRVKVIATNLADFHLHGNLMLQKKRFAK